MSAYNDDAAPRRAVSADEPFGVTEPPAPLEPGLAPIVEAVLVRAPDRKEVASRGAVQTFLIGLGTDVLVGVAFVILAGLDAVTTGQAAIAFGIAIGKSVVMSAARYVVRAFIDRSGFNPDGTPKADASAL